MGWESAAKDRKDVREAELKQVDETLAAVNTVLTKSVPEMNRMLGERGVGRIDGGKPIP